MKDSFIDYGALVDEAMHSIVKKSLEMVAKNPLIGDHYFFISFLTDFPDVKISNKLKKRYPDEMTIVLQHQFESLMVDDIGFSVILSFDSVKENIYIPFDSLTAFADPSVKFGLQFKHVEKNFAENEDDLFDDQIIDDFSYQTNDLIVENGNLDNKDNNVISIDKFRKASPEK